MSAPSETPTWRGDPALIVYAVRYALRSPSGSPSAIVVLRSVQANRGSLPVNTQQVIVRDVAAWLDGPGADKSAAQREPWVLALAALGVRRKPVRADATR